jgi:hypothetical protein
MTASSFGAQVGDTLASVVAEKGEPTSQILAGAVKLLNYPDVTIKFKDDVVISIKARVSEPVRAAPATSAARPPVPLAAQVAAARTDLKEAVDRVNVIVNQPVRSVPRTREIWNRCSWFPDGWFHPGAVTPDFNNVDIRKTQETSNYAPFEYVSSSLTPTLAFPGSEIEFNAMTKFFYRDRTLPKKKLSEEEMLEINRLYRIIGRCSAVLSQMGAPP